MIRKVWTVNDNIIGGSFLAWRETYEQIPNTTGLTLFLLHLP